MSFEPIHPNLNTPKRFIYRAFVGFCIDRLGLFSSNSVFKRYLEPGCMNVWGGNIHF
ncbi:hypothetical protein PAUR_b0916 [Pseudoalteromonas aurantia 208]|uniref:Uncharacterized protein n=1 Tax=Pseudoalteromonas aurantia 208 TaxID=1314867 RepID=A0ABR9EIH8_9GAMM|nr:hypothetical protein [Pseudoalteromonas aurantia 208]